MYFSWWFFIQYLKPGIRAVAALLRPRGAASQSGFLSGLGLGLGSAPALVENDGWVFQGGYGRSFSVILLQHPYLATSFPTLRQ